MTQSQKGYLLFGNNSGLLEFNGAEWTLYPSPNGTIIRAVEVVGDRVYSGCYMEFGYWMRNDFGNLEYVSLSEALSVAFAEDENIWNITAYDQWILFQSLNRIFLLNSDSMELKIMDFAVQRARIFNLGDEVIIPDPEGRLFRIENGRPVLWLDDPKLEGTSIAGVYKHGQGKMIIGENGAFYALADGIEKRQVDLGVSGEVYVYSTAQLKDGSFVLGTVSHGFIQVSGEGEVIRHVNQESGLLNNTVLSMFQDRDENLWLGLDNGISNVNLGSAFRIFSDSKGKLGVVYASQVHKGNLYLGTNQGLFHRRLDAREEFRIIEGTKGQVWSLDLVGGVLFCGHNAGTFVVEGNRAEKLASGNGTWFVKEVPGRDDLLVQGTYTGLSILQKSGSSWDLKNHIEGFDMSSRTLEFLGPRIALVNHEFKGVHRLELDDDYSAVLSHEAFPSYGYNTDIIKFGDLYLYVCNEGVFEFDKSGRERTYNELYSELFSGEGEEVSGRFWVEQDAASLWGFAPDHIIKLTRDNFDRIPKKLRIPIPSDFRRNQGLMGFENIARIGPTEYLIGTSNGYVVFDLDRFRERPYKVEINRVSTASMASENHDLDLEGSWALDFKMNSLRFMFSVPEYDNFIDPVYQYRLEGLQEDWSAWSTEPEALFGNLPFGDYNFVVRARVGNSPSENEASFSFSIDPPWYLTRVAIVVYFLLFLSGLLLVHRSYKRYYARQKKKLIQENQRNLELTRLANEQEIIKLKNERLEHDIESKNRELASATMSLINKNELLHGIKKDLMQELDKASGDQVAKIIDRNLNNDHDWEYFQEVFNNADKDFIRKLHEAHPKLTPNDLRFCAFLRLNLSSKEIAPLLNISVRSVEIKRYRLRKKMDLPHEKKLVEYILEI